MQFQDIHQQLSRRFGPAILRAEPVAIDPWIEVAGGLLAEIGLFLRNEPALRFNMLHCISGVDYFEPDAKKAAAVPWQPHLEVLYHLSSLVCKHRLVLLVTLPRWQDDVPGRLPELPTLSSVWKTANWHEREVFDLIGVNFVDHPDLTRILLPEDWIGHPLRKDYRPPHEYHGIARRVENAG
ncbi:MAG: NADH-quinone oxidoreductase subunit C [Planctomycetota bacterium]